MIDRRQLLALGSLLIVKPSLAINVSGSRPLFLSAATDPQNRHWLKGFQLVDGAVTVVFDQQLPGRAHQIAVHQGTGLFAVIARRPGTYILFGDLNTGEILQEITVPPGRHLFGHGVFSEDGKLFYTAENDYTDLQGDSGRIVVWSLERSQDELICSRFQDFPSRGVGPHELLIMPDRKTLVVANGGIRTHPDSGREKLNIESMNPSLVYLDRATGELLEKRILARTFHQASIRHLDVNAEGTVAMVMQYKGEPFNEIPLVALHRGGSEISFPDIPQQLQQQMSQYCGSVRFDNSGHYMAVSCPRANRITFWDVKQEKYIESVRSRDGCGVCATEAGFLFTAGTGRVSHYNLDSKEVTSLDKSYARSLFWDNHLTKVGV